MYGHDGDKRRESVLELRSDTWKVFVKRVWGWAGRLIEPSRNSLRNRLRADGVVHLHRGEANDQRSRGHVFSTHSQDSIGYDPVIALVSFG